MSRTKVFLLATFALVLSAGVVVGRLWVRFPQVTAAPEKRSWLTDQLDLSADQRQKMDAIWAETKRKIDKTFERRHVMERERDQAIHEMLSPEQQSLYDEISEDYREQRAELEKERDALVRDATERSRSLLSEEQKKRWEAMGKEGHPWHGPHPHGPSPERNEGQKPPAKMNDSGSTTAPI